MLRPEIFKRARIWPSLVSAHPKWGGGHPKKFNCENLKFALQFSVLELITSGLVGVSSRNFFSRRAARHGDKWVQFWKARPQKFARAKTSSSRQFGAIFDNFRLWWRISQKPIKMSKIGKALHHLQHLPPLLKKVGILWSTNVKVIYCNKFTP